ncbi:glycoside hydrolase family 15 protein [Solwaraspora sp. WMMD1047]|uniref:glycoside hydrolase family 15 protein n=1 Tax=Solwaraspora sp. WMMD1047 TaxID=3016102 RepID=UPI002417D795|nr:glycoside hydrolase family 15 protein [Solwaraspora sp. WMMD1047]MDG4829147.1 glycoside hydrolase family 15 protein [Solwaraspora sp. WMMD1047]
MDPIGDYGFLSDCRSAALVSRAGSIDWWCPARFDAPSVFGRLLDPAAGHWSLGPAEPEIRTERAYLPGTLVLRTIHHTRSGSVAVTDALATEPGARGHDLGARSPAVLLRVVEGLTGRVRVRTEFRPRPEYGLLMPYLHGETAGGPGPAGRDGGRARLQAAAGPCTLLLHGDAPLTVEPAGGRAEFDVPAGATVGFDLAFAPAYDGPPATGLDPAPALADTAAAWRSIEQLHRYRGRHPELVRHSALVLQGLTYVPSGAVVAAATTSLPEWPGGDRNYDYRYAWLRDFSFTMDALWVAACPDETERLFSWAARSAGRLGADPVPIMYGVAGERDLSEHTLDHLAGYAGSRPVRIGNDAWRQRQLDVPGEVLCGAYRLRDQLGELAVEVRALLAGLADQVTDQWRDSDRGMWEARDAERHYLSSKVYCWAALDRAVRFGAALGGSADLTRWAAARDEIRAEVLDRGWHDGTGAFTGAYGSPELDASALLLPLVDFLPATDPRMRATIAAIERELCRDGLVRRWAGDPAGFVLCSFWLVENLLLAGERRRAEELFDQTAARANDVGLFAEQIDIDSGAQLGNIPQALSHIGLINAAWRLTGSD